MFWNTSRSIFRMLRLGHTILVTALLFASSLPPPTPTAPSPSFTHHDDAEQSRTTRHRHARKKRRSPSLLFAHASPVPMPMTAPNATPISPRGGAGRTGDHVSSAPMVLLSQGTMAPRLSGSAPRDLLGFLAGGGGGVGGSGNGSGGSGGGHLPAPLSNGVVGPPKSGNGGSGGTGGTEPSKVESPPAGTKKVHKEKTPLLEGVLSTFLAGENTARGGGGGTGQASQTGGGATAWSSEASSDAGSSEGVSAILTTMANGGGIASEVSSFAHAKPTDGFPTAGPHLSASAGASVNFHSSLSATAAASSSSTNASGSPGTTRSELTEWKVIGVAVISITFIGIVMLLITFFDSWWGFVRDVGACGGAGWGCEGLCCRNLPKEDEHGVEVKEERHPDSTNATDVAAGKGWDQWKRLSKKVWGSKGDGAAVEGDWWQGKDGGDSEGPEPEGVDWYAYAYGDADAVTLPGPGSMEFCKGGVGDMVALGSSGSVWKASTLQVPHQPRSQKGMSNPVSVSRSASTSTSSISKSMCREDMSTTGPIAGPVQVQVQPPTPTTPPLSSLPTLPSATKLRRFLTGSPSQPGYPPFTEDPYVVGEVLRQTSAKRGGSRLKNVALPPV